MEEKTINIITMLVVGTIASFFFIPVLLIMLNLYELFNIWLACAVCLALFEAWLVLYYVPKNMLS